jgi:hypothetical protein
VLVKDPGQLRRYTQPSGDLAEQAFGNTFATRRAVLGSYLIDELKQMTPQQRRSALKGLKIDRTIITKWGEHGDCMTASINGPEHPLVLRIRLPNHKGYDSKEGEMLGIAVTGGSGRRLRWKVGVESDPFMIMDGIQTVRYGNLETEHAPNLLRKNGQIRFERYFTPAQLEAE